MRLSAVFVSSAFVLAGMSAALPGESENILARFADSDFPTEVDARAYDEEPELHAQGGAISIKNHKSLSATSREYDNDLVAGGYVFSRDGCDGTPPYTSHFRRSFYEPPRFELTRRQRENHHILNHRPGTSSSRSSAPPTLGSGPSAPGTHSSRADTPVRDWHNMSPAPYSPVRNGWDWHQVPPTPGGRTVPSSPGSSRPGTPGSSRPSTPIPYVPGSPGSSRPDSPEWRRVPNGSSHYRRSFYDLD